MTATALEILEAKIRAFADEHGYVVSEKDLPTVINGLMHNKQTHGDYYCPCRNVTNVKPEARKTFACPCRMVHADIQKNGHCHCFLFHASGNGTISSITSGRGLDRSPKN